MIASREPRAALRARRPRRSLLPAGSGSGAEDVCSDYDQLDNMLQMRARTHPRHAVVVSTRVTEAPDRCKLGSVMSSFVMCAHCRGFVPAAAPLCPHCDRSTVAATTGLGRAVKTCLKVATGGAVAVTLMACYGGPPHAYGPPPQPAEPCATDPNPGQPTDPGCAPPSNQPLQPANTAATGEPEFAQPPEPRTPGS